MNEWMFETVTTKDKQTNMKIYFGLHIHLVKMIDLSMFYHMLQVRWYCKWVHCLSSILILFRWLGILEYCRNIAID